MVRTPYRFSGADAGPREGAPHLGEHNVDVLGRWAGIDADDVRALEDDGTLYRVTAPVDDPADAP